MRSPALFAAALAFATACTPPPPTRQPTDEAMWLEASPPAPMPERMNEPPGAGAVWLAGYWSWSGVRYVWIPGGWETARPGWSWVPHRWERRTGHWRFIPGRWIASR